MPNAKSVTNRRRLLLFAAANAALIVLVSVFARGSEQAHGASEPSVSILNQPATTLPRDVTAHVPLVRELADPRMARLALNQSGNRVYVVSSATETVCLVVVLATNTGATCGNPRTLGKHPAFILFPRPDGTMDVAGLASDEFQSASVAGRTSHIRNNAFLFLDADQATQLTVSGERSNQSITLPDTFAPARFAEKVRR